VQAKRGEWIELGKSGLSTQRKEREKSYCDAGGISKTRRSSGGKKTVAAMVRNTPARFAVKGGGGKSTFVMLANRTKAPTRQPDQGGGGVPIFRSDEGGGSPTKEEPALRLVGGGVSRLGTLPSARPLRKRGKRMHIYTAASRERS